MAAIAAAGQDSEAEVTVVSSDRHSYRRPGIPALIAGHITGPEGASIFTDKILSRYNIKAICPAQATAIDTAGRTVSVASGQKQQKLEYDALVIATGGHPLIPKIAGADKKGVCTFTTYEAAAEIVEAARSASSAVVIGAGFIALEIAEALMEKGLEVYFNVRSRILRRLLEPELSEFLSEKFEQQGLKMLTGEAISEIGGKERVEYVVHKGKKIATGLVVMGTGVKPNVSLAEQCGIELGATGAIKVDNSLETSVKGIYAAGDCAESPDLDTGKFVYSPVGSTGAAAGKIAGVNAAGADLQTDGFVRAQADHILGYEIFSVGHSTTTAKDVGLDVQVYDLSAGQAVRTGAVGGLFESAKILMDAEDRIVGAQLIAKKYGSQFACQLYSAVLDNEAREKFLARFNSPRRKLGEALLCAAKSNIVVENIGVDRVLSLGDKADA